jgi:hypothetical protein
MPNDILHTYTKLKHSVSNGYLLKKVLDIQNAGDTNTVQLRTFLQFGMKSDFAEQPVFLFATVWVSDTYVSKCLFEIEKAFSNSIKHASEQVLIYNLLLPHDGKNQGYTKYFYLFFSSHQQWFP